MKEEKKTKEYRCYGCGVLQEFAGYCLCCKEEKWRRSELDNLEKDEMTIKDF